MEFSKDKTVKLNYLDRVFDLIKCYLTIKTEYQKMKMEKTEFGNKTDFIGPYNYKYNIIIIGPYEIGFISKLYYWTKLLKYIMHYKQ